MPASRLGSATPTNNQPVIIYEADRSYIASVIVTNIGNVEHYFTIYVAPNGFYTNEEEWVYYTYQTKINKFNSYESVRFAVNEGDRIIVQSYLGEGISFSVNGVYDSFGRTMVHTSISDPRDPAVGDIWVKTEGSNKLVFIWNGTAWTTMTDAFYGTTAPTPAELGRFWIDSTSPSSPILKSWNGSAWVAFSGVGASLAPYDAHIAATTNVHGILSTAALVYTDDARLSNSRTPVTHATSHASAGSDPITIAQSQVTNLVTDLSNITSSVNLKAPLANPSFTGTVTLPSETILNQPVFVSPLEKVTVSATNAQGTINFDALTQAVLFYTSNATNTWILNVRGSATDTLNSIIDVGQSIYVTFMVTNGATPYYQTALNIDGVLQTVRWQGGTPPSSGNANSIDMYRLNIIKTATTPTYTVLGQQIRFA